MLFMKLGTIYEYGFEANRSSHKTKSCSTPHTHLLGQRIVDFLDANDIVFFDDCLFSQYNFIKDNESFFKDMAIDCVLGFSSGLYAAEDAE